MFEYLIGAVLFIFFIFFAYRVGYTKGYKRGASVILAEWKSFLNNEEDDNYDEQI